MPKTCVEPSILHTSSKNRQNLEMNREINARKYDLYNILQKLKISFCLISGWFGNSSSTSTTDARLPEEKAWLGTTINDVKGHEIFKI